MVLVGLRVFDLSALSRGIVLFVRSVMVKKVSVFKLTKV